MSLLETIEEIGQFNGEYQADYPTLSVSIADDDSLTLTFCEFRNIGSDISPIMSNLGKSTVTIFRTRNGKMIDASAIENAELAFAGHFGGFSVSEEIPGFVQDEVTGELIDTGSEKFGEYIAEKTGKAALGNAIGYIPIAGDIASFAVDMTVSSQKAEEDAVFIKGQFDGLESAKVYSDFDCSVSIVQYKMADNEQEIVYAYAGENTFEIVANVNEALSTTISGQDVIENPNEVWKTRCQKIEENPENGDRYDEAVSKK